MGFPGSPWTLLRAAETACTYVLAGSHPKCRHREFAALHELASGDLQLSCRFRGIANDEAGAEQ